MEDPNIAELNTHGEEQVLHLPEGFRLPGTKVRLTRVGRSVMIEPLEPDSTDMKQIFAEIDRFGGDFLSEGRPEQPATPLPRALFKE